MSIVAQSPLVDRGGTAAGLRQWLIGCGVAVTLHVSAIAMLLATGKTVSSEDTYGAMAMEVGIANVAPSFDTSEAAEASDAPVATTATAAAEAVSAHEEAIPAPHTESAEADQQVAQPSPDHQDRREREDAKEDARHLQQPRPWPPRQPQAGLPNARACNRLPRRSAAASRRSARGRRGAAGLSRISSGRSAIRWEPSDRRTLS